jgi:hypothetical protein
MHTKNCLWQKFYDITFYHITCSHLPNEGTENKTNNEIFSSA